MHPSKVAKLKSYEVPQYLVQELTPELLGQKVNRFPYIEAFL